VKSVEEKLFEEVLMEAHLQEMAAVGELKGPKIGHYYLEVFSREYEHEAPHVTLEEPRKPHKLVVAKIALPEEQPKPSDDPVFMWTKNGFAASKDLRKAIAEWLASIHRDGLTGWQISKLFWEGQAKAISWGQRLKDG
jgi:hypothetical protein